MKIKSEVIEGIEFDVELYDAENGKKGIQHESLENILYNQFPKELGVKCNFNVIAATSTYSAVECKIEDANGRKVFGFSDTNLEFKGEHSEEDDFVKQHPLIKAVQYAMDTAVKNYLKWPRMIQGSSLGYSTTEVSRDDNKEHLEAPPFKEDKENTAEAPDLSNTSETCTEMNSPEKSENPEAEPSEPDAETKEQDETAAELEDFSGCSLEELGLMLVKTGTYKNKTLDEVWEIKPSWFDYVLNKSKSSKFDNAREYAGRKQNE